MYSFLLKIWRKLKLPTGLQLFLMRRLNDQFLVGVTGVFFDNQNRIFLVKHSYRGGGRWSLPGGYAKGGEHPKEAIEREVKEESGYTVSADERLKIRTDRNSPRLDITYTGEFFGGTFVPSAEVKEAKLFKFGSLPIIPEDQLFFIDKALKIRQQKDKLRH